jgi:methylmalonyl-CoA mutase
LPIDVYCFEFFICTFQNYSIFSENKVDVLFLCFLRNRCNNFYLLRKLRTQNYHIRKMEPQIPYIPKNKVRIVTAASLFDGHDAAINIMRRIIQATGVEVIHLGHDRSVEEVVNTAIQEDANAIAMTSYQGGHNEYFKYMHDLLKEKGAGHIKIFGGGGGVILPSEI